MADQSSELRRPSWAESYPFVRLFRTAGRALGAGPMLLAFAAVVLAYTSGRVLDGIWIAAGAGVQVGEVNAYSASSEYGEMMERVNREIERMTAAAQTNTTSAPTDAEQQGPFITLARHEMHSLAMAVRGVVGGRLSYAPPPAASLVGGVSSSIGGFVWILTERTWFTIFLAGTSLVIFAFFGCAICRVAAVRSTRNENLSISQALAFAREKWFDCVSAPLMPVGVFVTAGIGLALPSLIGAIPGGEIISGLTFGLALLVGIALVGSAIGLLFGFHLMWPTIAVEGSDSFDSVQHAAGYLISRPWSVAFYSFSLFVYGAIAYAVVRGMLLLLLKLTHVATGIGIGFFGMVHTSGSETVGKLDGMWSMPRLTELPLLPAVAGDHFWGRFDTGASLGLAEQIAAILLRFWVYGVVGLLGAFIVSFYFCGSTEMYFLLRREIDSVEYDEMFYEEFDEDDWDSEDSADNDGSSGGTSLPVVPSG